LEEATEGRIEFSRNEMAEEWGTIRGDCIARQNSETVDIKTPAISH